MATKTKTAKQKAAEAQKTAATDVPDAPDDEAKVSKKDIGKKPFPLTDRNTPIAGVYIGQYAKVVSGDHEGRYGVIFEDTPGDEVLFRTRDDAHEEFGVKLQDLRPALPGGR